MSERLAIVLSALEDSVTDCTCSSRDEEDSYCAACTELAERILFLLGDK